MSSKNKQSLIQKPVSYSQDSCIQNYHDDLMEPSGTLAFYLCLLLSLACVHAKSPHSCPALCDPMDCVACEAPLDMGFSCQEYWNRLPCPPSEDLPDPWIEPESLRSPALLGRFFTTSTTWEASGRPFSHVHDLVVSGWLCCLHMSNLYARYKEGNEVWPFHSRKEGPPHHHHWPQTSCCISMVRIMTHAHP